MNSVVFIVVYFASWPWAKTRVRLCVPVGLVWKKRRDLKLLCCSLGPKWENTERTTFQYATRRWPRRVSWVRVCVCVSRPSVGSFAQKSSRLGNGYIVSPGPLSVLFSLLCGVCVCFDNDVNIFAWRQKKKTFEKKKEKKVRIPATWKHGSGGTSAPRASELYVAHAEHTPPLAKSTQAKTHKHTHDHTRRQKTRKNTKNETLSTFFFFLLHL